tara:strand:+ start:24705 stop:26096 length:1392 start_codon:yes stop_codon:yes gene_type:complete
MQLLQRVQLAEWTSAAFVAVALLAGVCAQEEARVFIEVDCPSEVYQSQPIEVVITLGYDDVWFEEHGVSLFRQHVDVPFHVDVPWVLAAPERAVTFVMATDANNHARVAVGDRILDGRRLTPEDRDGRSFARVELRCRWLPLSSGNSTVAPVRVRFAYANEFRDNLLRGREPVDQQQVSVSSVARQLQVQPLPNDAPPEWSGAVGEFELEATSRGEQVHVGESFQVEVTIRGDGNHERFAALRPPTLDGFHVQGVVERRIEGARRFVLDVLALRKGVSEMPGVSFVSFSPAAKAFITTTTATVPVKVLPQREGVALTPPIQELVDKDLAKQDQGVSTSVYRWGFVALAILGLVLQRRSLSRKGHRALQDAVHQLRLALTKPGDADRTADAFEAVMAKLAGGGRFSAPSVWKDLQARGVAAEGLKQLQAVHAELDAARFGGPMPSAVSVMGPVDTLVAASSNKP